MSRQGPPSVADLIWIVADMTVRDVRLFQHEFSDEMKRDSSAIEECSGRLHFLLDRFCDLNSIITLTSDVDTSLREGRDEFQKNLVAIVSSVDRDLGTNCRRASATAPDDPRSAVKAAVANIRELVVKLRSLEHDLRSHLSPELQSFVQNRRVLDFPDPHDIAGSET